MRKLLGIETAGSLSILFSDKTGTITQGILQPHVFLTGELESYENYKSVPDKLQKALKFTIKHSAQSYMDPQGNISGGNSTERAFLGYIDDIKYMSSQEDVTRIRDILFSSKLKFSAAFIEGSPEIVSELPAIFNDANQVSLIKGAPEILLSKCNRFVNTEGQIVNFQNSSLVEDEIKYLSSQGTRVIAVASYSGEFDEEEGLPDGLIFLGAIGLLDEVRPESKSAIKTAADAGIQVVMVTGDRLETAVSIAEEVGLLENYKSKNFTMNNFRKCAL